jgi:PAS domain S-box-containing protein
VVPQTSAGAVSPAAVLAATKPLLAARNHEELSSAVCRVVETLVPSCVAALEPAPVGDELMAIPRLGWLFLRTRHGHKLTASDLGLVREVVELASAAATRIAFPSPNIAVVEGAQARERIANGDSHFKALFEASRDAISVSVDGRHAYVNPAYLHAFGYTDASELIGEPIDKVIAPQDRAKVAERSQRRLVGESAPDEYEFLGLRKDGSQLVFDAKVSLYEIDGIKHALVVCRDITELKRHQAALQEAEERLRLAVEGAHLGIWHWNIRTQELEWSNDLKEQYGLPPDAATSFEVFIERIHPDDREAVNQAVQSAIETGEELKTEFRIQRPDGEERWMYSMGRVFFDKDGAPDRFLGVSLDTTDRKEAEEYVYRLNAILEQRVQERTEEMEAFTYSVSHDLRAPLRAVMSTSMILLDDYGDTIGPEGVDMLRRQAAAAKRLGNLIDDLLGLSRIGRSAINPATFDLSALAEEVGSELAHKDWGYPVRIEVQPGLQATGDPKLLRYCLQNLIENAFKFARAGTPAVVRVGAVEGMEEPTFFVGDDGIGFDMQYVHKIFQPFERLHRDNEYPGTGVGLASVQRIIQRHGGRIWAESVPGQGSTFYFSLKPETSVSEQQSLP